ncbi:hypothetical protein [Streptomyces sp. MJM1172]|uniref:hypothetical protein n=1 Tax=Streptomyces sp. MJM1172 TaxID=1703926 RepID=UPI00093D668F|nr:hypothetical protein [Streptomyces sp. MJM1172]
MALECSGDPVEGLEQAVGSDVGQEREDAAGGFGGCFGLGPVSTCMLDRDVGGVQGPVSGEGVAVEEYGLLGAGGGPFVLAQVGAGEGFETCEFGGGEELQPPRIRFCGPGGVVVVGADDRRVGGLPVAHQGPATRLAGVEKREQAG